MTETTIQQPTTEEAAFAEIDFYSKETDRLLGEMKQRQVNIDRLQRDSDERLDRIDAALEKLSNAK